jgi:hypothetical protein
MLQVKEENMTLYPQNDPVQMVRSLEILIEARYQFFGH